MSVTLGPRLGLMLNAAAGDAHPNEFRAFLRGMDALSQISAKSRTTAAQPASPANGDTYILPASATGTAWGGKAAGTIAYYTTQQTITSGGTESTDSGWDFLAPKRGFYANVEDEGDACYWYDGGAWQVHYKEGTWTPTLTAATPPTGVTYSSRTGFYIRVGKQVFVSFGIAVSGVGSGGSGNIQVSGLPFPVSNLGGYASPFTKINAMGLTTASLAPHFGFIANSGTSYLMARANQNVDSPAPYSEITASTILQGALTYSA